MTLSTLRKKFIGSRTFYAMVMSVVLPIIVQNGITNFVSLLDNIMVGRVGTEPMSGVAIVNQLMFVYNLCVFGGLSGAGIFTAQFYGSRDVEGVRHTFRFKLLLGITLTVIAAAVFLLKGEALIGLYLNETGETTDLEATLRYGLGYMRIMLLGLPPFMLVQVYASTLRECSETVLPMKAGIMAMLVNLVFNYFLIYGHLGFPAMGVEGAAAATVLSRYLEALVVVTWTHRHADRHPFIRGAYRSLTLPRSLCGRIILKGMPLLLNEALWSSAQAILNQCYSVRGLSVVAAMNISSTITNLFSVIFFSMGSAISIVVGQRLGEGNMEDARDTDNKMIAFSMFLSVVSAALLLLTAPLFPRIYNTTEDVRHLAARVMMVVALFQPQQSFLNATYFTLRSGGKTLITFLFDSVSVWVVSIPLAFVLTRYTGLDVVWILALVQMGDWIKCVLGFVLVKRGVWIHNIVEKKA